MCLHPGRPTLPWEVLKEGMSGGHCPCLLCPCEATSGAILGLAQEGSRAVGAGQEEDLIGAF